MKNITLHMPDGSNLSVELRIELYTAHSRFGTPMPSIMVILHDPETGKDMTLNTPCDEYISFPGGFFIAPDTYPDIVQAMEEAGLIENHSLTLFKKFSSLPMYSFSYDFAHIIEADDSRTGRNYHWYAQYLHAHNGDVIFGKEYLPIYEHPDTMAAITCQYSHWNKYEDWFKAMYKEKAESYENCMRSMSKTM